MKLKFSASGLLAVTLLHFSAVAMPTNVVRLASRESPPNVIRSGQGLMELRESVETNLHLGASVEGQVEIIAWSIGTDDLECPPRIFEEAIVAGSFRSPTKRIWILAHLRRMPGTGEAGLLWKRPQYPPPMRSWQEFSSRPTPDEISRFVTASDFGYNCFDKNRRVVDVTLFEHSTLLCNTLERGLSLKDKEERSRAFTKSLPY